MKLYYYLKRLWFLNFITVKKIYTKDNLHELKGTYLQYLSNDLCMKVFIAEIDINKGLTLMGRWFDIHDMKYEDKDSVIFCINKKDHNYKDENFLKMMNDAIHSGVFTFKHKPSYFGGRVDDRCAFR